jgi:hypothetical protein
MLLSDRRRALVYLCMAGMEAAWATSFFLLFYRQMPSVWLAYAFLLGALLAWILVLDLLNRTQVASPLYQVVVLGLIAATSLVILLVAPGITAAPPDRLAGLLAFGDGIPIGIALALTNLFLWQRATSATSRDLSFFNVGVSFRLGLLLLVVGAALASARFRAPSSPLSAAGAGDLPAGQNLLPLLWLYFGFGLLAVALARIGEKSSEAQSAGRPLPLRRMIQLLLAVGLTLGLAGLLSQVYTAQNLNRLLTLLVPLWQLVRPVVVAVVFFLLELLSPVFDWLIAWLRAVFERGWTELLPVEPPAPPPSPDQPGLLERLPSGLTNALGSILLVVGILVAAGLIIAFFLLYLERVRRPRPVAEDEEETAEPAAAGTGLLDRGAQALRDLAGLVRRFGLGRQLLAAVSVQNIYANVCRLARQRGYPRHPSQPPDAYLPTLTQAFSGQEEALARITAAYMRVHYGDRSVSMDELTDLRADYHAVREADKP